MHLGFPSLNSDTSLVGEDRMMLGASVIYLKSTESSLVPLLVPAIASISQLIETLVTLT